MFERFTTDARTIVIQAQQHARRLGHRYIGCEHLLLAVSSADAPAGAVLREHGVTPEHVEEQIVRQVGLGTGASLFADLDAAALAAIGIDLDAVRARIEGKFGADALTEAAEDIHCRPRSRLNPRRAIPPVLVRRLRRRRFRAVANTRPPQATGRYRAPGPAPTGHLPFTTRAKKCLENTVRESQARNDKHIGVEHVTLGLIAISGGLVGPILAALGTSAPTLRTAIVDRYRQAS
ncbi:MAG TPA: Clp protease N-terminal domain-containing protein [Pseudonocardiaceae bacterium]|nr:Clp protease N-terminal domain-containing protein [Pseudonocardiaceae bacterium]